MKKKSNLFLLVLSNGGYDGLGKERTEEMAVAAKYMGFVDHKVLNDPRIPDGPRVWNTELVSDVIKAHLE